MSVEAALQEPHAVLQDNTLLLPSVAAVAARARLARAIPEEDWLLAVSAPFFSTRDQRIAPSRAFVWILARLEQVLHGLDDLCQ
eukprot:14027685-Alexandrium_andersonii.AAC.1